TIRRRAGIQEKAEEALLAAVNWIAAEVRGRPAVWVEAFRGHHGHARLRAAGQIPSPDPVPHVERENYGRLQQVGHRLTQRMAEALARPGEDFERAKLGPWVAAPPAFVWYGSSRAHRAPFAVWHGAAPDHTPVAVQAADEVRQPVLYWFTHEAHAGDGGAGPKRPALWRAVMRGCWPIVPWGLAGGERQRCWKELAQLATFGRQWVGGGYLRPCGDMLVGTTAEAAHGGRACAATDGCGRYFAYFNTSLKEGVELATLPGEYRYYWFSPTSGAGVDSGDGIEGGRHCRVPAPGRGREALLILEQAELSDPMAAW
ncbi:MAG: hypothetical protein NTW87_21145, partial [Planctomycetota bacterium]|nr:hypothetical protein [Planctomycetota bacterium]